MSKELFNAIGACNLKEVRRLIEHAGADVNAKYKEGGYTPLHTAILCHQPSVEIAEYLIENGAKINEKDGDGRTPLCMAAEVYQTKFVGMLLEHGADRNIKNHQGKMPYDIAKAPQGVCHPAHPSQTQAEVDNKIELLNLLGGIPDLASINVKSAKSSYPSPPSFFSPPVSSPPPPFRKHTPGSNPVASPSPSPSPGSSGEG